MTKFNQLCVWPGTLLAEGQENEFLSFMKEEFSARIQLAEVVLTLPDTDSDGKKVKGTGGRSDIFFYVHDDDIPTFAVKRLMVGIRWWEDVLGNGGKALYPKSVLAKYPNKWKKVS